MINNNKLQLEVFNLLIDPSNIIRDERQIQYAQSLEDKGLIALIDHKQGVSGYFNKAAVGDWVYAEIQKTEIKTTRDDTNHCRFSVSLQNSIPEPYKDPKTQKNYRNTRSIDIDIVTDGLEQDSIYNPYIPFSLLYTGIIQTEHFIQSVSHNEISGFPYRREENGFFVTNIDFSERVQLTSSKSEWLNKILDVLDKHRKSAKCDEFISTKEIIQRIKEEEDEHRKRTNREGFISNKQIIQRIKPKKDKTIIDPAQQIHKQFALLKDRLAAINWLNSSEPFLVEKGHHSKGYKLSVSALPIKKD